MQANFTEEQKEFYGDYFKRYASYLSLIQGPELPKIIQDTNLYNTYEKALKHIYPRAKYVNETFHYKIFHNIFKYSPITIRDHLMNYFMNMPEYERETQEIIA